MWIRFVGVMSVLLTLAGCAGQNVAIKTTQFGGDRGLRAVDKARQFNLKGVNEGDTVIVAPGSQKAVVASSSVMIQYVESIDFSKEAFEENKKKDLAINRKPGARLDFFKGKRNKEGQFSPVVQVLRDDPSSQDIEIDLMAINRSEEPFRGDLIIYDWIPAELSLIETTEASKYKDISGMKTALSIIPFAALGVVAIDSYQKMDDAITVQTEELDQIRKYTLKRLVLEPGQIIGFKQRLKYNLPNEDELEELRLEAHQRMSRR